MKKISSLILALTYIVSAVSCDVKVNGSSSSDTALVSVEASEQTKLTNHMTEKERSMVKVGKLTVFDHEMNNDEKIVPDDGIYFEIWSSNDWIEYYKHYRENYPDDRNGSGRIDAEILEHSFVRRSVRQHVRDQKGSEDKRTADHSGGKHVA